MRKMSVLLIDSMLEHVSEVKVVIFRERTRNPFAGMVGLLERLSDVRFNEKRESWQRTVLRQPLYKVKSREVRLVNL